MVLCNYKIERKEVLLTISAILSISILEEEFINERSNASKHISID
mgnify:CR=1 FL=1